MYQSTTSWMMTGGTRGEMNEDRRTREPQVGLDAAAMREDRGVDHADIRGLMARWTRRLTPATGPTLDCCPA